MNTSEQQTRVAAAAKRAAAVIDAAKRAAADAKRPVPAPAPAPQRRPVKASAAVPAPPVSPPASPPARTAMYGRPVEVWGGVARQVLKVGQALDPKGPPGPDGLYADWKGMSVFLGPRGRGGRPESVIGQRIKAAIDAGTWNGVV